MSCSTVSTWRRDAAETRIGSAVCPPALAGARANFRCSCVSDAQVRVRMGVVAERMPCFAPATQDRFQRRIFHDALGIDTANPSATPTRLTESGSDLPKLGALIARNVACALGSLDEPSCRRGPGAQALWIGSGDGLTGQQEQDQEGHRRGGRNGLGCETDCQLNGYVPCNSSVGNAGGSPGQPINR